MKEKRPRPVFALVDANSFYASCERVFRPDLANRPIVVLSNNDGCVVTRSAEAKKMGIRNGTPAFRLAGLIRSGALVAFSSNYELYGDLSARMMRTVAGMVPRIEPYSIDECFADLTGMPGDLAPLLAQIRARVLKWIGIPTCVSCAQTKTLAKLANHLAKTYPALGGTLDWTALAAPRREKALSLVPVGEIWGVGGRSAEALRQMGARTALEFARLPASAVRRRFGVVLARTHAELNGLPCIELESAPPPRRQIMRSRSFARPSGEFQDVAAALTSHTAAACRQLRSQGLAARTVSVFFQTNVFDPKARQCFAEQSCGLSRPSADTLVLTEAAVKAARRAWRRGFAWKKAGVMLSGLEPEGEAQPDLFEAESDARSRRLMTTLDRLSGRYGRSVLQTGTERASDEWAMSRRLKSPCYTTRLSDLPRVS